MAAYPTERAIKPDIIKYFYEEPASLETLAPDAQTEARQPPGERMTLEAFLNEPRYYRGYLAGTSLETGSVGLTSLRHREALLDLLMDVRSGRPLALWTAGDSEPQRDPSLLLDDPGRVLVGVLGDTPLDSSTITTLVAQQRRHALGFLRNILDQGMPVIFPEPAHDGFDWSIFSPYPILPNVLRGLERLVGPSLRAFAIPHRRARSEEKFYFERYDPSLFEEFEVRAA